MRFVTIKEEEKDLRVEIINLICNCRATQQQKRELNSESLCSVACDYYIKM